MKKEVLVTMDHMKAQPEWILVKNIIDNVIEKFREIFPESVVEYKESEYAFEVWVDGEVYLQIHCVDLLKTAVENNLN